MNLREKRVSKMNRNSPYPHLRGKNFSSLGSSGLENFSSTLCTHPAAEAMYFWSLPLLRLKRHLHLSNTPFAPRSLSLMGYYNPAILSRKHLYNYMQKTLLSQDRKNRKTCPPNPCIFPEYQWIKRLITVDMKWKTFKIPSKYGYFRKISYPQVHFSSDWKSHRFILSFT